MGYEHREDAVSGGESWQRQTHTHTHTYTHTHTQCPPGYTGWLCLGQ